MSNNLTGRPNDSPTHSLTFSQVSDLMAYFKYKYFSAKRLPQPPVIPAADTTTTLAFKLHQRINRDGQSDLILTATISLLTMPMA